MKFINETWRPVVGFEKFYLVSDLGRVMATFDSHHGQYKSGRILKNNLQNTGYHTVTLCPPGAKPKIESVHRLILTAFEGPPNGRITRHLDGCRANSVLTNLKWGTHKENSEDRKLHGNNYDGERHWKSKLTESAVRLMRQRSNDGASVGLLMDEFQMSDGGIRAVLNGVTWKAVQ